MPAGAARKKIGSAAGTNRFALLEKRGLYHSIKEGERDSFTGTDLLSVWFISVDYIVQDGCEGMVKERRMGMEMIVRISFFNVKKRGAQCFAARAGNMKDSEHCCIEYSETV